MATGEGAEAEAAAAAATGGGHVDTVPYPRFQSVVSERDTALNQVRTLEGQLQASMEKAATVDTMGQTVTQLRGQLADQESRYPVDMALAERGFDADGRDIVRMLHGKLPEEDRPTVPDWLDSFGEDPSKAPRPLQSYLDAPGGAAEGGDGKPAKLPRPGKHAKKPADTGAGGYTTASIVALREEAQRSGNWAPVQEAMAAIQKEVFGTDPPPPPPES